MRFVDEAEVASVLRMEDLIPAMRRAMIDFSEGRVEQPTRHIVPVREHNGFFGGMPAVTPAGMGAKLVCFYPENGKNNLPTHMATIALFRPETGEPLVIMDGRLITEMRTAAVTATFVDAVAAPNVRTLAMLGAGLQAESHIEALAHVRNFDEIRIWNRTPERAEKLAAKVGGRAMGAEEAVRGAEVVVTTTGAGEPIIDGRWLTPGAKIAGVGWSGADGAELDATTMSNTVIVDSRDGTRAESGNIRRYKTDIYAELGEVLDGSRPLDPSATVVFDSIGMACQDVVAAALVWNKLRA
jgi:thiomorpholine-carboxylate dehydrogenase